MKATWLGAVWFSTPGRTTREEKISGSEPSCEKDRTLVQSPDGESLYFARDSVFASPSAAAAVVTGRAANGRKTWMVQGSRKTYGEWETEGIEEAIPDENL
ncbi:DUF4357 domain-containing protein [Nocardia carnea]|uniref:DUF4357 domain-containing protein n=1 Tax=Nocardia carnea TaxID=37328 RepID=UPI0024573DB3|nr:DUF4357 domain-containing protein [Nocardia carnea]